MKNKRLILSAAILGGTLGLAANPLWAQTAGKKERTRGPGPNPDETGR